MTLHYMILWSLLVLISVEDLKSRRISNRKVLFGSVCWLFTGSFSWMRVIGTLGMSLILWSLSEGYLRIKHRTGFGKGDIKLIFMIQLYLGLTVVLYSICFSGFLIILISIITKRKDHPLGPWLSLGALIVWMTGGLL